MRKTVGVIALISTLFLALPAVSTAADAHPKKYGVELQLGGGVYMMEDVNDFIPADFIYEEPDKINIGSQFGVGIIYRHMENFGWQIGFNRLAAGVPVVFEHKYEVRAYLGTASEESWMEQTVSGYEVYFMATWYKPTKAGEWMLGVGPALYKAVLDRSIDIVRDSGPSPSHLTGGSFTDAKGKALGLILTLGYELPMGSSTSLVFQGGGRLAQVGKLTYDDPNALEGKQTVYKNAATGSTMAVDFTGAFAKVTFRAYFKPSIDWRQHPR
ncbi:MAG TPA: hypothetical protein ENL08_03660 [Bacteroidetes bacterium]|nr:hypothetical protein [Bacteroidota bacterium]